MQNPSNQAGRTPVYIATGILWLATAVLGLVAVYHLHTLAMLLYGLFISRDYYPSVLAGQVAAVIGGIIWLFAIIASGEYHLKHAGERKSWQIIAWILGIEILIVAVGSIIAGGL